MRYRIISTRFRSSRPCEVTAARAVFTEPAAHYQLDVTLLPNWGCCPGLPAYSSDSNSYCFQTIKLRPFSDGLKTRVLIKIITVIIACLKMPAGHVGTRLRNSAFLTDSPKPSLPDPETIHNRRVCVWPERMTARGSMRAFVCPVLTACES